MNVTDPDFAVGVARPGDSFRGTTMPDIVRFDAYEVDLSAGQL